MTCDPLIDRREISIVDFDGMSREDQIIYLTENIRCLPDFLVDPGIDILIRAGETELAISLAKDSGRADRAVEIAVEEGDFLWAALISKKAGRAEESERLYREGLRYYISAKMYGRAVSAARCLGLPEDEVLSIFEAGVRHERMGMEAGRIQYALQTVASSLEDALLGRDDEIAEDLRKAMAEESERGLKRSSQDLLE